MGAMNRIVRRGSSTLPFDEDRLQLFSLSAQLPATLLAYKLLVDRLYDINQPTFEVMEALQPSLG
jgi:hypothetical protein